MHTPRLGHSLRARIAHSAALAVIGIATLLFMAPVLWVFSISIKTPVDAFAMPPKWIFRPTLENHLYIWAKAGFGKYLKNSLIAAVGTPLISVPIGALAAYAFSRFLTKYSRSMLYGILAIRMFPPMMLIIPYYIMARHYGMYDNIWFLLLTYISFNQPFTIWLMHGFFSEVPRELDEAALLDGCNFFQVFWRVILPIIRPALIAGSIFSFSLAWSEFFFGLILTTSHAKTLTVATVEYQAELIQYWSYSAAAVVAIVVPAIVFLVPVQRYFVRGLSFGAVKG